MDSDSLLSGDLFSEILDLATTILLFVGMTYCTMGRGVVFRVFRG